MISPGRVSFSLNVNLLSPLILTRSIPPWSERILHWVTFPSAQQSSMISNPPRQRKPLTLPVCHSSGNAGSKCMYPVWLCTSISAMPAAQPKLPSIWKGGCASKRLGYVPPVSPNDVMAGFICSRMSFMAWLPSSRRAHRHTFHPIDHPVEGSPRAMRLCLAASKSSGVSAVIWLPGYSPQRCDT